MMLDESIERALHSAEPFKELRSLVMYRLSQGEEKKAVLETFEKARQHLRQTNREMDEDVLMEIMDCLVGWCSPQMRLPPDSQTEVVKDG